MQRNSKRTPEFFPVKHTKSCFPIDSHVEILTWEPMERLNNDSDLSLYSCPGGAFRNSEIYKFLLLAHISIAKSQIEKKSGGNICDRFRAQIPQCGTPNPVRHLLNFSAGKFLVKMSAIISEVGTFLTSTVRAVTSSRMKWWRRSMCLLLACWMVFALSSTAP